MKKMILILILMIVGCSDNAKSVKHNVTNEIDYVKISEELEEGRANEYLAIIGK